MNYRALCMSGVVWLAVGAAGAGALDEFMAAKRASQTEKAWRRAERRLRDVRVGMTQPQFFEAMRALVLARNGRPTDIAVDGYVGRGPRQVRSEHPCEGQRRVAFGYRERGRRVVKQVVTFCENRVQEILTVGVLPEAEPEVARLESASSCDGVTTP